MTSEQGLSYRKLWGSSLRCLLLTGQDRKRVADFLMEMASPSGAVVSPVDHDWMPQGFLNSLEAMLDKEKFLVDLDNQSTLSNWWLIKRTSRTLTPNWDIASTCFMNNVKGLILVEAKAYDAELKQDDKTGSEANYHQISNAIGEASAGLNTLCPGWSLSADTHYQLSNRFAWAWKLATMGIPVVLIYLGFLNAREMSNKGVVFTSHQPWVDCLKRYASRVVPDDAWDRCFDINGTPMWVLLRSAELVFNKTE